MDSHSTTDTLAARYERIEQQLSELFKRNADPVSRMATACAVLHHKMPHFFWTGFYRLVNGALIVGPYQGPLACSILEPGKGVCWDCANSGNPIVVEDVDRYPGHIACDSRSKSEVVVPVHDGQGRICGVLDVDSDKPGSFCQTDANGLKRIAKLIYLI